MNFTQEQICDILDNIPNQRDGYRELLKMSLEAIMRAEREAFNTTLNDSSNGYRLEPS